MKRARDAAARDDARDDARAAASWLPRLRRIIDASASPLSFLSFVDRARVEAVSRQARDETRDPSYWREFCQLPSSQKLSRETQSKNADALNGLCGCASGDVAFFSSFLRKSPALSILVTLDLGHHSLWSKITDASLLIVAAHCPALASLNVKSKAITDIAIKALARPALTSLNIGLCEQVTDTGLEAIATNCPGLIFLKTMFCERITDTSMMAIARNCPSLARLNLGGCHGLTSATLTAVGTHLSALQDLRVLFLSNAMTDAVLECIAAGCPQLSHLDIGQCKQITDRSLDAVVANCSIKELDIANTRVTHEKYRAYWSSYTAYFVKNAK
mmetsp:Transcript_1293/g.3936  ORF Transcript_1293/g.3936 Transcript_1293/m.3936 type:complete len:331 (+) Transcript_1293:103-1095(+)